MKCFKSIVILAGVLILIVPMFSFAGEAKESEETEGYSVIKLEEIVVTATKTEKKVAEVPQAVTVIDSEDLKITNAQYMNDALRYTPGLSIHEYVPSGFAPTVQIRGLSYNFIDTTTLLIDGIPLNTTGGGFILSMNNIPVESIERVGIARGPLSALYGRSSLGGVINIITKKGTEVPETTASAHWGSWDLQNYAGSTRGKMGSIGYHLSYNKRRGDGYVDHSEFDDDYFLANLNFELTENTELLVMFNLSDIDEDISQAQTYEQMKQDDKKNDFNPEDCLKVQQNFYAAKLRHKFTDNVELINNFYFNDMPTYDYISGDFDLTVPRDAIGDELQMNWKERWGSISNTLTLGAEIRRETWDAIYYWGGSLWSEFYDTTKIYSGYIQNEFHPIEPLSISFALRYDYFDFEHDDRQDDAKDINPNLDAWSPKFGVSYEIIDNINLYGSIGRAFRPPKCSYLVYNPKLDPEYAWTYEIGAKMRFFDRLQIDTAFYWYDIDDQVVTNPDPNTWVDPNVPVYINAGKSRIKGIELAADYRILKGLHIYASIDLSDPEYRSFETSSGDFSGKDIPQTVQERYKAGIRYLSDFGLSTSLDFFHHRNDWIDSANTVKNDSYSVVNLSLNYIYKRVSFDFKVNNLLDEEYAEYAYMSAEPMYYPNPTLNVYGGVSFHF